MSDLIDELKTLRAEADFASADDPFALFARWFEQARQAESPYPEAMCLATVDEHGMPDARMVLLKGFDERGFVFYTNMESAKGRQISATGKAALTFWWRNLKRQVRIRGLTEQVSDEEADAYFASRPRGSRIGAWASQQSREMQSPHALEKRVAQFATKYAIGPVPRPHYWTGMRVIPLQMEFWHERPFRLHERIVFRRDAADAAWQKARLYP